LKDSSNNFSPCHKLSHTISIPAEDYKIAKDRYYPYTIEMNSEPGTYAISIAVKDVPGKSISYIQLTARLK
jgi:hypothetical protein